MKSTTLLLLLVLTAGCHTAPPSILPAPADVPKAITAPPIPITLPVVPTDLDQRLKQQRQMIESLMSQNDALTARINATAVPPPAPVRPSPAPVAEIPKPPTLSPETPRTVTTVAAASAKPEAAVKPGPFVIPNADGVIDLTTAVQATGEPVNPFAVRQLPADSIREITLRLSGIIGGGAPAALVNGRAVQPGESVESLILDRCEAGAAVFRKGEHWLRLPVSAQPVRIRVAL